MYYYLIWMCSTCTMSAPVNVGLYDSLFACESAKEQVAMLSRDPRWVKNYTSCIPKGVIK